MSASTSSVTVQSPYVGLTHFTEEYADRFFGRDAQCALIIGNLRGARLTLLYAESGVGKSSLLRAGVVARLRAFASQDVEKRGSPRLVPVVFSSWSDRPLASLIDAIGDAIRPFLPAGSELDLPRDRLDEAIHAATETLDATLLVILDQFEEHFNYPQDEAEDGFADQLARCIDRSDVRANFLISIRQDAYASLGDLFRGKIANVYSNFLHLDYLDPAEAREAIEKPLERTNELHPDREPVSIEPALVDAVLEQVRLGRIEAGEDGRGTGTESKPPGECADRIETTYLQLVMKRLWDEETATGSHVLGLETLERLGGAQTIIGTHLDRSMAALAADQQVAAASIFRFLVTSAGTKIALTAKDLSELTEVPGSKLDPIVHRLSAGDLHILRPIAPSDGRGEPSYEIFHDALARPIRDWRTRKERAEAAARLEEERAEKEKAQREASEAARREASEKKRKRMAVGALGAVIVAFLGVVLVFAISQRNQARDHSEQNQSIEAAERIFHLAVDPTAGPSVAALASIEAYRLAPTVQARNQTLGMLQVNAGLPKIGSGHTRGVNTVAFLPGSSGLVSGSSDGTVRLWDLEGAEINALVNTGSSAVSQVAVSPLLSNRQRTLAAARADGSIDLWDVANPEESRRIRPQPPLRTGGNPVVALSPEGPAMLAAGGADGQITLWDLSDPRRPEELAARRAGGGVTALAFTANGGALLSASEGGAQAWGISGSGLSRPQPMGPSEPAWSVAAAPNGSLAVGYSTGLIDLFDGRDQEQRQVRTTTGVRSLAFARRGAMLVSGGDDWNVSTWDVESGRLFGPPRVHALATGAPVWDVAVSPDGTTIASAGEDRLVKLWPLDGSDALARTVGGFWPWEAGDAHPTIRTLAVSGDEEQVAAAAGDAGALVWSLADEVPRLGLGELVARFPARGAPRYAVAYHGDVLAVAKGDSFELWSTGSSCPSMPDDPCRLGRPPPTTPHSGNITNLAFGNHDDRLLLASGDWGDEGDGVVSLWDASAAVEGEAVEEGGAVEHLWDARVPDGVLDLDFSPTAPLIAVAGDDGRIRAWNLIDPSYPAQIQVNPDEDHHGSQPVAAVAFSPEGDLLASGGQDQQVVLWEVSGDESPPTISRLTGIPLSQTQSILTVAFSPDGRTLAAGDGDGSTCVYDVESRRTLGLGHCLLGHHGDDLRTGIFSALFTQDGAALLTAGEGNPILAWDSILWSQGDDETEQELRDHVCTLAGRNLTEDKWDAAFRGTDLEQDRRETCPQYPLP